jgi:hypothetical protein
MIAGGDASPYQIVAGQVMLARWAGIPARIGFGFYSGQDVKGVDEYYPVAGAAWLEAYFQNYGWVPIIGTPLKAQPNLSKAQKHKAAQQAPQLALSLEIPVQELSIQLLYQIVRYWAVRVAGVGIPLVLLVLVYPAFFKTLRRRRRRRWAARVGPVGRIAVAYANFRERCYDLNIGDPRETPLEFCSAIAADPEHEELAWLVTRVLWGDLRRDLRIEHVVEAEEMAKSVAKRVSGEQPMLNRVVGAVTRTSLRDPWSQELPNFWPRRRLRLHRPALLHLVRRRLRLRLRRPLALGSRA